MSCACFGLCWVYVINRRRHLHKNPKTCKSNAFMMITAPNESWLLQVCVNVCMSVCGFASPTVGVADSIFCSFGVCQSYLLGCVVWLLACMLELCLLSGLKDCCLFIFTVRKNTLLFFHFYFAAQQASLLIWSIFWVHRLEIIGVTIHTSSNCLWLYLKSLPCLWIRWEKFGLLGKHFWEVLANLQENKINLKSLNSGSKAIIPLFTILNAVADIFSNCLWRITYLIQY